MGSRPTLVVGLAAEARIARPLGWTVVVGGGGYAGATAATELAVRAGARALVSFGLAGGLDPALRPGAVVVATAVLTDGTSLPTDPSLRMQLGQGNARVLLGAREIAALSAIKKHLFATTGAAAVDLESGAVARVATEHGLPFAVLRVICDPAERDLPPAALLALDRHGAIGLARVLASVVARPSQMPALMALAADAAAARRSLRAAVIAVGRISEA